MVLARSIVNCRPRVANKFESPCRILRETPRKILIGGGSSVYFDDKVVLSDGSANKKQACSNKNSDILSAWNIDVRVDERGWNGIRNVIKNRGKRQRNEKGKKEREKKKGKKR